MALLRKITLTSAFLRIFAQFVGAIIAGGFVFIQINAEITNLIKEKSKMGVPYPGGVYEGSEPWAEAIGTFFIMYVFMATSTD